MYIICIYIYIYIYIFLFIHTHNPRRRARPCSSRPRTSGTTRGSLWPACVKLARLPQQSPASRRGRDKRGFHRRVTFPYILPYFVLSAHVLQ